MEKLWKIRVAQKDVNLKISKCQYLNFQTFKDGMVVAAYCSKETQAPVMLNKS